LPRLSCAVRQEGKKALKAGTLETVVETMAAEEATDPDFVRDVLMTYRYFTTGDELLKRLLERFSYRFEAPPATGYGAATIKPSNIPLRYASGPWRALVWAGGAATLTHLRPHALALTPRGALHPSAWSMRCAGG